MRSISVKSSVTQLREESRQEVGLKFIRFFPAFSPHPFRHAICSLHQPFAVSHRPYSLRQHPYF